VLVVPTHRRREINTILRESHYIGHSLYMETKLSYLFYPDLLNVYDGLVGRSPGPESLIKELDAAREFPSIQR